MCVNKTDRNIYYTLQENFDDTKEQVFFFYWKPVLLWKTRTDSSKGFNDHKHIINTLVMS
jgi:hypothetical protein